VPTRGYASGQHAQNGGATGALQLQKTSALGTPDVSQQAALFHGPLADDVDLYLGPIALTDSYASRDRHEAKVTVPITNVTDRRTDGQTDGRHAIARSALH